MWTFRSIWSSTAALIVAAAIPAHTQQLAVEDAIVSDFEGGIGVPISYQFSTGQKAHLAFRIAGFTRGETEQKISMNYTIETVDCDGLPIVPTYSGAVERRVGSVSRTWTPTVRYVVDIPPIPRAGTHNFRVRVRDNVAGLETLTGVECSEREIRFGDDSYSLGFAWKQGTGTIFVTVSPLRTRPEFPFRMVE